MRKQLFYTSVLVIGLLLNIVNVTAQNENPSVINLNYFKAKCINPDQNLFGFEWVTASELNNKLFTVEYSVDGKHFSTLIEQPAAGISNNPILYNSEFIHFDPTTAMYFRLKQTGNNGDFSYSKVIAVISSNENNSTKFVINENVLLR